jgi:AmmeMemoRadiSam system protein B/AmmeMemoRadiSam system protein A
MVKNKMILLLFIFVIVQLFPIFMFSETKTREYLKTGTWWYPSSKAELNKMVGYFFDKAKGKKIPGKVVGIIGPHAGLSYSGQCAANAYVHLRNRKDIRRVILMGASHRSAFYGAAVSDFDYNATPLGELSVDTAVIKKLAKEKYFTVNNSIMQNEHSIENHLPFLQKALEGNEASYKIVPIIFGGLRQEHFKLVAKMIGKYINEYTLVIASTDFTHYGSNFSYTPFKTDLKNNLTKLDMGMINQVEKMDLEGYCRYKKKTGITMCGFTPVGVMMNLFESGKFKTLLTDYYKSGDQGNDYSHCVSYASFVVVKSEKIKEIEKIDKKRKMAKKAKKVKKVKKEKNRRNPMELSKKEKKVLLTIARDTLKEYFTNNKTPEEVEKKYSITDKLKLETGVFVTLKKKGQLRGCIGSLVGKAPVYLGVMDNAISAALKDPRFMPVREEELKEIDLEISVMTPLQKIKDYKQIRLGIDGVIIKKGYNQAVYLPQVATETGWNLDEFLGSLCRKAGLPINSYKSEGMEFLVFQAQVFGEKESH